MILTVCGYNFGYTMFKNLLINGGNFTPFYRVDFEKKIVEMSIALMRSGIFLLVDSNCPSPFRRKISPHNSNY